MLTGPGKAAGSAVTIFPWGMVRMADQIVVIRVHFENCSVLGALAKAWRLAVGPGVCPLLVQVSDNWPNARVTWSAPERLVHVLLENDGPWLWDVGVVD
jgi:hypothetical protein